MPDPGSPWERENPADRLGYIPREYCVVKLHAGEYRPFGSKRFATASAAMDHARRSRSKHNLFVDYVWRYA